MPKTGGLSSLTWESCSPESEACFCSRINVFFFLISRSTSEATRTSRFCAAIHSRALWTLPVTSCSCTVPRPFTDGTIRQGFTLLPDSDYTCSHDVTLHIQKQTSQSEGFPTRAHVLCSSVTRAVYPANRTHRAGHVEFYTRVRVENPSCPNPATQPGLCPSAGSATSTAGVPGPGLTPAAEHVGVSCVARPGPHARCCANPACPH